MTSCADQFDVLLGNISLKQRHVDRIESATNGLTAHLSSTLELDESQIFMQGSYANGTAIRPPESGAYDVDLIVVCSNQDSSAKGALDDLYESIADHGRYTDRLEAKTPCVRVNYADDDIGSFHVDVVPVRESTADDAPLDAPRRNAGWHGTAPTEFTEWCGQRGEYFVRTVKTLKRWRNEQQEIEKAIKSIVLQVLTEKHMPTWISDDAERLTRTLESMNDELSQHTAVPAVLNPVLESENLTSRWSWAHFQDFRFALRDAATAARAALDEPDSVTSSQMWKELLGREFPLPTAAESNLSLEDASHRRSIASKSWHESPTRTQNFEISARIMTSNKKKIVQESYAGGALKAGWRIKFKASVELPADAEVWWQVTNTGVEARNAGCLRGGFERAKKSDGNPSEDSRINWEDTAYTGSHLVQAFLVDKLGLVLGKSNVLRIDIRSPAWRIKR